MNWIAAFLVLYGVMRLSHKQRSAWLYAGRGCCLWCIYGCWSSDTPMVVMNAILGVAHLRNWWVWGRDENPKVDTPIVQRRLQKFTQRP